MKTRLYLSALTLACLALPAATTADPLGKPSGADLLNLASLTAPERPNANMTVIPDGTINRLLGLEGKQTKDIRFAGRCGSSNYYCTSPGFTYCCGNSTDGFYCAADVNGC